MARLLRTRSQQAELTLRPPSAAQKEKALHLQGFPMPEEDSNLHPVIPHQALNIVGLAVGWC